MHSREVDGSTSSQRYPGEITAIVPHSGGALIAATSDGFAALDAGHLTPLASPLGQDPTVRMNDGACDPRGRFFAGSMSYDASAGRGHLYRLDLDGSVAAVWGGLTISNGIDWSPDGSLMYLTDSATKTITAFTYDADTGSITGPRRFLILDGTAGEPDGMAVDADGNLWIAMWNGWQLRCYSCDAALLDVVDLPVQRPTSVAFAGSDLTDLYITTSRFGLTPDSLRDQPAAGRLVLARPGTTGRVTPTCRVEHPDLVHPQQGH